MTACGVMLTAHPDPNPTISNKETQYSVVVQCLALPLTAPGSSSRFTRFSPSSQKHGSRWIGYVKVFFIVNGCVKLCVHGALVSYSGFQPYLHSNPERKCEEIIHKSVC